MEVVDSILSQRHHLVSRRRQGVELLALILDEFTIKRLTDDDQWFDKGDASVLPLCHWPISIILEGHPSRWGQQLRVSGKTLSFGNYHAPRGWETLLQNVPAIESGHGPAFLPK